MNDTSKLIKIGAAIAVIAGTLFYLNHKGVFKGCCSKSKVALVDDRAEDALLTLNGKIAITPDDFDKYVDKIVATNPQMSHFLQAMPDIKERILDGLVAERVMNAWAEAEKIRDSDDFKKTYALALEDVEKQLVARAFQQYLVSKITIADAEIADHFEKNKDLNPRFIEDRGGLKAHGIAFNGKKQATEWAARVGKPDNFKTAALKDKLQVEDLGVVNDTNFKVDKNLKKTIAASKKLPALVTARAEDGKEWVVFVEKKEAPRYRALAEVSDEIRTVIMNERMQEVFVQEIAHLKVAYGAQENRSLFKRADIQLAHVQDELTDETKETNSSSVRVV